MSDKKKKLLAISLTLSLLSQAVVIWLNLERSQELDNREKQLTIMEKECDQLLIAAEIKIRVK